MMQNAQKRMGKWVVRILLSLLILSFAVWGIGDYIRAPSNAAIATVGDTEIESQTFINESQRRLQMLSRQQNRPIDPQTAIRAGLYNQILSGMIDNATLGEEADDMGLAVSDDAVAAEIRTDPGFASPTGKFDRLKFEQTLSRAGFSEAQFVANMRQDMVNRQLEGSLTAGLDEGPAPLAKAILAWQLESRSIDILQIPNDALATAPEPTEDELRAYHKDHAPAFTAPELRAGRIVLVRPEDLADRIEVTDQQVQDSYEARMAEFTQPARRDVKQAIFQDEETAKQVLAKVHEGVSFGKAVEDATGSPPIDVGEVAEGDLPGPVGDAAFLATKGEVVGPVRSSFGWHLVEVTDIQPEKVQPLEEVRDTVVHDLKLDKAIGDLVGIANRVEDELATGARTAEVADTLSLPLIELPPVNRQGLTLDGGDPAKDLPPEALEELFASEPGDDLAGQELDDGTVLVVETTEVRKPALQPFDDVRDEVRAAWTKDKLRELADAERQKLEQRLAGGESLADIAGDFDAKVETADDVTRRGGAQKLSGKLRDAVFDLKEGESTGGDGPRGASQILATVTKVDPVEIGENDEQAEAVAKAIGQSFAEDLRQVYLQALRNKHGVSINQQAFINAVDPNGIYLNQ